MAEVPPRWDVLDVPGVTDVIEQAARNVNRARPYATEYDDLKQEALVLVATRSDLIAVIEPEFKPGYLFHGLRHDLLDLSDREARHRSNTIPFERLVEAETH